MGYKWALQFVGFWKLEEFLDSMKWFGVALGAAGCWATKLVLLANYSHSCAAKARGGDLVMNNNPLV
ncbi:hypothetical protein COLO4_19773 [Corchorus olitorius]|uniref:Uncharacterized protein n=1 Tax=Corchorus olitorius TaxID=93759 RepID=A0A1R3J3J7_9ROSI|nr:hypothetical protein COLO4_19773 [Corchorus olitorius]